MKKTVTILLNLSNEVKEKIFHKLQLGKTYFYQIKRTGNKVIYLVFESIRKTLIAVVIFVSTSLNLPSDNVVNSGLFGTITKSYSVRLCKLSSLKKIRPVSLFSATAFNFSEEEEEKIKLLRESLLNKSDDLEDMETDNSEEQLYSINKF